MLKLTLHPGNEGAKILRLAQQLPAHTQACDPLLIEFANVFEPQPRSFLPCRFSANVLRAYNEGPATVHPKESGWVVRQRVGQMVLEQMTWGFPVVLREKQGQPLKPKPVNNARFDKLGAFWKRWAALPEHRCLIPTSRYAEAVGTPGRMTET